jgi:hypothetical protein
MTMTVTLTGSFAVCAVLLMVMTATTTTNAFSVAPTSMATLSRQFSSANPTTITARTTLYAKRITDKRRKQLGIADDEDEYDLDFALDRNTDPFITKVIAGSLILSIATLLVYAIVIPATTDYGEGVCNALLTGGRC